MRERSLIHYPFAQPPDPGEVLEVADGVLWARLSLPTRPVHVNAYILSDDDGWSVVDTGFDAPETRAQWQVLLAGPLHGRPVARVIATHHHTDHIGLAGWFHRHHGAQLWTTRVAWLSARMLTLEQLSRPTAEQMDFWRAAGETRQMLAARAATRPFNYADRVGPLPQGYRRIRAGEVLRLAGRDWQVHIGEGHAPEHATLWSHGCPLVLAGDQILPRITPPLGVQPFEPEADPVGDWLASCARLADIAREDHLVLPGHKRPFSGLPQRLHEMRAHQAAALDRLAAHLAQGQEYTAIECFTPLFRRAPAPEAHGLALGEAVGHLNHLLATGRATRRRRDDGAWAWSAVQRGDALPDHDFHPRTGRPRRDSPE